MARSRTIKRSSRRTVSAKKNSGWIPHSFNVFMARRIVDVLGLAFILSGAFMLLSFLSYNHSDPSWNTAGQNAAGNIQNLGGAYGAQISDLLFQTIGIAGFLLPFGFIAWGLRILKRDALRPLWLRIITLLAACLCVSLALAQVPARGFIVHPFMGSSVGTILLTSLAPFTNIIGSALVCFIAGIMGVISFAIAAALKEEEFSALIYGFKLAFMSAIFFIYSLGASFLGWLRHYNDETYVDDKTSILARVKNLTDKKVKRAPFVSAREDDEEEQEEEEDEAPRDEFAAQDNPVIAARKTGAIPVIKPKTGKGPVAKKPSQQQFNLSTEDWELPDPSMLAEIPDDSQIPHMNEDALRRNAELLQNVLADFNIEGEIVSIHPGPVVTLYELEPSPGTKTSRVISLANDIARSMSAISVRIAVVPGRNVIGIELPNKTRQIVYMRELLSSQVFEKTKAHLPLILGKDIGGQPILADLAKMPHLLVAGTTGSGKSVAVNTMILSLLFRLSPDQCRFIMIDPKMLELSVYDDIPHLLSPVVTEPGKAVVALKWAVNEMEDRYRSMSKMGVRNIEGYNERMREAIRKGETMTQKVQTGFEAETGKPIFEEQPMEMRELPYIVVVVDEFADLMLVAGKDVENAIQRLAQMARAAGIHLIMATQRPSVDVITGVIKANFPTRISFAVTSKIDSRTILGEGGAEQLLGMGDMLYMAPGGRITRVHGPFVSDSDVELVTTHLREQSQPSYIDAVTDENGFGDSEIMNALFGGAEDGEKVDELYDEAVALVAREGKASTSFVQRYLQIGYNRAARIIEEMERQGVISRANAVGKRSVLINDFSDV